MISTILTPGVYTGLVDVGLLREALNLEASGPSNAALIYRIEEAAQRVEPLAIDAPEFYREPMANPNWKSRTMWTGDTWTSCAA